MTATDDDDDDDSSSSLDKDLRDISKEARKPQTDTGRVDLEGDEEEEE